ncbi:hypothetical protein ACFQUU_27100 [Herbaspirillum sp. GCM10030257]|uniref:hypothetical protein n=1 Tax=Herbaspirillum sp. GCM10030257 TaxID=3273393 RepID=UPI00361FA754
MSISQQTAETGAAMAVKAAPPVIATGWAFWGFTLNEWAAIFAITYSALGILFTLIDRYTKWRKENP